VTNPIANSNPTVGSAPRVETKQTFDKDMFLKLLVAQLKYQNPLSPTDPTAFMQQSAQFSMVEAMEELEKTSSLSMLATLETSASALIGKNVIAANPFGGADITGTVTGYRVTADGPVLKLGNTEVPLSSVKEVRQAVASS